VFDIYEYFINVKTNASGSIGQTACVFSLNLIIHYILAVTSHSLLVSDNLWIFSLRSPILQKTFCFR